MGCGASGMAGGMAGSPAKVAPSPGPRKVDPRLRSTNTRASVILQKAMKENLNLAASSTNAKGGVMEEDELFNMSLSQDEVIWNDIRSGMSSMTEERRVQYMHEIHSELRLFIKSMKVLSKLASDMDIVSAIEFMTKALKVILNCEFVSLFILNHEKKELRTHSVASDKITVPFGVGIAGTVASTGKSLNIEDAYKSPLFNDRFDKETGHKTDTILCVPLEDEAHHRIAVLEAVNCRDGPFKEMHEVNLSMIGVHLCNAIKKCQLNYRAEQQQRGSKALLELFKVLYTEIPLDELIQACVDTAKELVSAERGALFLYDEARKILWSKSAHGLDQSFVIVLQADEGLAGRALQTGKVIRTDNDLQSTVNSGWQGKYDKRTGFETRNLIAVPITDPSGRKLGVIQALNKKSGDFDFLTDSAFSKYDEELLSNFTAELGRAIGKRILEASYEFKLGVKNADTEAIRAQLMEYMHTDTALGNQDEDRGETDIGEMDQEDERLAKMIRLDKKKAKRLSLRAQEAKLCWHYDVSMLEMNELCELSKDLFLALEVDDVLTIDEGKLENFIREVGQAYRDVPYHNFNHAVSVFHGVYAFLALGGLRKQIDSLEALTMAVAALCHDVGHDGFTNGYHMATESERATLYNDIHVQENFHASLANRIFQKEENKFVKLEREQAQTFRKLMIQLILSTDMSEHMDVTVNFCNLSDADFTSSDAKLLIMKSVLHAVDISTPTKPFDSSMIQAENLQQEFKRQVASEMALGLKVSPFMNPKDEMSKAQLELNFIDYVVSPIWKHIVSFFPKASVHLTNLESNRKHYQRLVDEGNKKVAAETITAI